MSINLIKKHDLEKVCYEIPKAELHIHFEGTLEPELVFQIAERNGIKMKFSSPEEMRKKYNVFDELDGFLDVYYHAAEVLLTERDYSDVIYAYLKKSRTQGVKYCEVFFDPQSHIARGIPLAIVINGIKEGMELGQKDFAIEAHLMICLIRHLPEANAINVVEEAMTNHKGKILGMTVDSTKLDVSPKNFVNVFKIAKEYGLRLCAHVGDQPPIEFVESALDDLHIERIDHGNVIVESEELMNRVAKDKIPMTLCPLSNKKFLVCSDLTKYPLRILLDHGIIVTLNGDDPAFNGGYLGDNFNEVYKALNLTFEEIEKLAKNSFIASFMNQNKKDFYLNLVDEYVKSLK